MLNRLTVSSLIQSVIVLMSTWMMALLCVSAWDSWGRLTTTSRISVVADASVQPDIAKYLRDGRAAEMPAMRAAAAVLDAVEFADQKTLVPELNRLIQAMTALEAESWDAMHKPKASRRAALGKEYAETTAALLETMDKVSV